MYEMAFVKIRGYSRSCQSREYGLIGYQEFRLETLDLFVYLSHFFASMLRILGG